MIYPQNFEQKIGFDQVRTLLKEKCLSTVGQEKGRRYNIIVQFLRIKYYKSMISTE